MSKAAKIVFVPDMWKNGEKTGKAEFLRTIAGLVKDEVISTNIEKLMTLTKHYYELALAGVQGTVSKELVVAMFAETSVLHIEIPAIIEDVLNTIDAETSLDSQSSERSTFCYLVKESERFLSEKMLKERLEIDTLQESGVLKDRSFYTKFIKVKTKLYYKQRKFNLFREESEGYAKLCVELNHDFRDLHDVDKVLKIIKSLIGCFNLDPNRVLDLILESFETRSENHLFFTALIRAYMNDAKIISEVLGFKYTMYHRFRSDDIYTPKSLYVVTALFLQNDIISLDDIYTWLMPDDKVLQKEWDKELKDAKEYFRKTQVVSTKETTDVPSTDSNDTPAESFESNQKFGLCQALLEVGDWKNAKALIEKMPEYFVMQQESIAKALSYLIHVTLEPIYRKNCQLAPKIPGSTVKPPSNRTFPKQVETFAELSEIALPMIVALGPSLHYDPTLLYKIIRLSKAALHSTNSKDKIYFDVLTIIDTAVLPSLSFMDCNCCISEEIWNLIKMYPYQHRYCLYGRWKNETNQVYPALLRRRGDAQKKIKNIMKRVSKETIKPVGRHIGKLTHCAPGFLFDYMLLQIQIYDNLINPVVDSLKYLTNLSYDVLGYCLIEALAQVHKNRYRDDSQLSISQWLQSLAAFCGAIFKKYSIELTGLLQFVANQLKAQNSLDLLILKEIVQKMAGIEASEELTNDQLNAMAGGEILKAEAGQFSQIRNTKKSSMRLKEAMADEDLAVALCLLIAQQKFCTVFYETEKSPLKLVGKLYDQCQDSLVQFGMFLASTMTMDEYVERLPSIQSMLKDYYIRIDVAFFLTRPMFTHAINQKYENLRKNDPNYKKLSVVSKQQIYFDAVKEVNESIIQSIIPLHSSKVWEDISPQFLVTFWSLTMYDLYIPSDVYQKEVNKLKVMCTSSVDVKDPTGSKTKKEQERYVAIMEKLQDEKKKQQEHVERVMYRLKQEKDSWFILRSVKSAKNETITQFLQLCIFRRCLFTAVDALYCAKFIQTLHSLKAANFSTLLCYDRLFCDITNSVTSCTENEANRYGRFLCAMLETSMRWHSKESIFNDECLNHPGFVTKFRVSNQFSESWDQVGYENYRHVCHKWHYKIAKSIIACLESKDYVAIRNALIVLIKILPHFPVLSRLGNVLEKKIERVREEEKTTRQDLFVLATSYSGQLKAKLPSMVKETDFHSSNDKVLVRKPESDSNSATRNVNGTVKNEVKSETLSNGNVSEVKHAVKSEKEEKRHAVDKIKESSREKSEKKSSSKSSTPLNNATSSPSTKEPSSKSEDRRSKEKPKERERTTRDRESDHKEKHTKKDERREERKEEKRDRKDDKQKEDKHFRSEPDGYFEAVSPAKEITTSSSRSITYSNQDDFFYNMPASPTRANNALSSSTRRHYRDSSPRGTEDGKSSDDSKRRKTDIGKSSKEIERRDRSRSESTHRQTTETIEYTSQPEKLEKKERSSKVKRDKLTDEEKELRKERKLGRKRDRLIEETVHITEQKRRKDDDKVKIVHADEVDLVTHGRERSHRSRSRDRSPYVREKDKAMERVEKQYYHSTRSHKHV